MGSDKLCHLEPTGVGLASGEHTGVTMHARGWGTAFPGHPPRGPGSLHLLFLSTEVTPGRGLTQLHSAGRRGGGWATVGPDG